MVIEKTLPILRVLVFKLKLVNKKLKENVDDFSNLFFFYFFKGIRYGFWCAVGLGVGMRWRKPF